MKKQPTKKLKKQPVKKRRVPPDPERMNTRRAYAALRALRSFADDFGESWKRKNKKLRSELQRQNLSDLLCDLAHLCDREGFDFVSRLHVAENHYHEETAHKGKQLPPPPAKFAEHGGQPVAAPPATKAAAELKQAIAAWRKAAVGDSGDEENDAGNELASLAESYLRSTAAMPAPPMLDASELATVLAALRLFQREFDNCEAQEIYEAFPDHFAAVNGKQPEPLGSEDIDTLCQRLNTPAPESAPTANSAPLLRAVCQTTLDALENMTTEAFTKGGDKSLRDGLRAALAAHPKPEIVIEINEGIAEVREYPDYADVRIVDWDMFECGDNTMTGENAVVEDLRAWLEANEPEWYAEQMEREADLAAQRAAATPAPAASSKPPKPALKLYPVERDGKTVMVTIPESNADAPEQPVAENVNPYYVDIPKQPSNDPEQDNEWENVESFPTRDEALAFAQENFGADENGMVSLVSGGTGDRRNCNPGSPDWPVSADAPDESDEAYHCNHPGCTTMVHREDPYFGTFCGTYCSEHMREHMRSCEICRKEFTD